MRAPRRRRRRPPAARLGDEGRHAGAVSQLGFRLSFSRPPRVAIHAAFDHHGIKGVGPIPTTLPLPSLSGTRCVCLYVGGRFLGGQNLMTVWAARRSISTKSPATRTGRQVRFYFWLNSSDARNNCFRPLRPMREDGQASATIAISKG